MSLHLILGTKEYVLVDWNAEVSGVEYDPTGDAVEMAIIAGSDPPLVAASDWKAAAWETSLQAGRIVYSSRLLVGTTGTTGGAVTLAAGTYSIWGRVTDTPEKPVKSGGVLVVR